MFHAGNRQHGVTVYKWLLCGLSYRTMVLTNTREGRVLRPME